MTKSLLEVVLSEERRVVLGIAVLIGSVVLRSSRKEAWSSYAWLPLILISTALSFPFFFGFLAGAYGAPLIFTCWPFPIAALVLCFARPAQRAIGTQALIGVLVVAVVVLALFLVPTSVKKYYPGM